MAQWVKVLVSKSDDGSSDPIRWKKRTDPGNCPMMCYHTYMEGQLDLHIYTVAHTCPHVQTKCKVSIKDTYNKNVLKVKDVVFAWGRERLTDGFNGEIGFLSAFVLSE